MISRLMKYLTPVALALSIFLGSANAQPMPPIMFTMAGGTSCTGVAAVTLNPSDKDPLAHLSGSNLTITSDAGSPGANVGARATVSFAAGKKYFEGKQLTGNTSHGLIGWANATQALNGDYLGDSVNALGLETTTPVQFILNNLFTNADSTAIATNTTWIGIAFDITSGLAWETHDGVNWNTSMPGTQSPSTGTGGYNVVADGLAAGPYFPAASVGGDTGTDSLVLNFIDGTFAYGGGHPPAGFTAVQPTCGAPAANAYALSGPNAGTLGVQTTPFTAISNGNLMSAVTVTPNDSGHGGAFVPASCTLSTGNNTACTFQYTPALAGTFNIATTNSSTLINPNPISFLASPPSTTSAFFVAATGNDANNGSINAPFRTIAACQNAMRNSATVKTCEVRSGNVGQTSQITLTDPADRGETWEGYAPDGTCAAHLDGGFAVFDMFVVQTTNVTFRNLDFQNVVQAGINPVGPNHGGVNAVLNMLAQRNCFHDFHNDGTNGGPVNVWGAQGVVVDGNLCYNVQAECFNAAITQAGDNFSGWIVKNNVIINCNLVTHDMGCIYAWSGVQTQPTPGTFQWTNNYINNYSGSPGSAGFNKALYLDDAVSGGTITGNVILGDGEFAIQVHGGQNNIIDNNVIDVRGGTFELHAALWQGDSATNMSGNTFRKNIIINHGSSISSRQFFNNGGCGVPVGGNTCPPFAAPTIAGNIAFNFDGGPTIFNVSSDYSDSSPITENPLFSDTNWTATLAGNSPVFGQGFIDLIRGWGPTGFQIPNNGTAGDTTFNGQPIREPSYLE